MFTHLRAYSTYSIGYGAMQVDEYVKRVKALGMTACALTESGVLYSAIIFIEQCHEEGIQPILGLDVAVKEPEGLLHLLLIAENATGYQSLMYLATEMQTHKQEGVPYALPADIEACGRRGGVFLITGHRSSRFGNFLLRSQFEDAREMLDVYQSWFGNDHVYLEVQNHHRTTDLSLTSRIMAESKRTGIPVILTNQTLYSTPENARKHVLIRSVLEGRTTDEVERSVMEDCHIRSEEEMAALYPPYPELLTNVETLRSRIHLEMDFSKHYYPEAKVPEGETEESYLIKQVKVGFDKRWGHLPEDDPYRIALRNRLNTEFPIIKKAGYMGYLLIVSEFIRWALEQGQYVGLGRGSGAGSLILNCLDITNIDPLRWKLLFERFLTLERVSAPDIDSDFEPEFRDDVVNHCIDVYGEDRVASIITYTTLGGRAAIRDAGRVTGVPNTLVDKVAKMIPKKPDVTLDLALGHSEDPEKVKEYYSPDLAEAMESDIKVRKLVEDALLLEGLVRGTGVHAAGKVISSVPVRDVVPLQYDDEKEQWVTQFEKHDCETVGLMKMDFLGLDTLTVMRRTVELVKETTGEDIDLNNIPLDDADVYREIYSKGRTAAVFQFESAGMRRMLQEFKPSKMEDIILLNASYRPGPMQYIPGIIAAKNDPSKIHYDLPDLEPILSETYGFPVYQENVMQIFQLIAGYSLGEADIIRRAMAGKKMDVLAEHKPRFIQGCIDKGISPERADEWWNEIMEFAKYGFNKSHAGAYSINSYDTAYLKYHFPAQFMSAAMSVQKLEKLPGLIQECRALGLQLLPPDINISHADFYPEGHGVRFGIRRIKGVAGSADKIIDERDKNGPFKSLTDFIHRTLPNSKVTKALIEGGALDGFGHPRASLWAMVDNDWSDIQKTVKKLRKELKQASLFELEIPEIVPPDVRPWSVNVAFQKEYAVLQAYVNGHPAEAYKHIRKKEYTYLSNLDETCDKQWVNVVVLVEEVQNLRRRSDNAPMAKLKVSDESGQITGMLFTKAFAKNESRIKDQEVVILRGFYKYDENDPQINVEEVEVPSTSQKFYVKIPTANNEWRRKVKMSLLGHEGTYPLYVYIEDEIRLIEMDRYVKTSFLEHAKTLFGESCVEVMG